MVLIDNGKEFNRMNREKTMIFDSGYLEPM